MPMRRHRLLEQMADRHPRHDEVRLLAHAGEIAEDGAAALGLGAEQDQIVVMGVRGLGVAHQLLGHHGDGRERRAEAVRRRGGKAVERRQFLLARQHELGCGERTGHAPRLFRRAPGIEADEQDAEHHGRPDAEHIRQRQEEGRVMEPGQRQMVLGQQRGDETASPPSATVTRGGKVEADTVTGAISRKANGFSNPPVRNNSAPSWSTS